jgi:uncharacterized RDD family membrane protein YckC
VTATRAPAPAPPTDRLYAGAVSRTVAYVIDVLLVTIVVGGIAVAVSLMSTALVADARDVARFAVKYLVLFTPAFLAFYSMLFWRLAGRTPGMALLDVRVVTVTGRPVSWLASLVRAVLLAYLPVCAVWSLVDRRRQGVHDKLARTVVVRTPVQ